MSEDIDIVADAHVGPDGEARVVQTVSVGIVERLRLYAAAEAIHAPLNGGGFGVMREAADAIEELTAEVERLRAAGDALVQLACLNPNIPSQEDWEAAIAEWEEARREHAPLD